MPIDMAVIGKAVPEGDNMLEILGISCLTNYAAGILDQALSHQEVIDTGKQVQGEFVELLSRIVLNLSGKS